ncbi:hypothetical protein [Microvirga alba]|uniref:DUF551 domain-containing protein n=1 Tax=Microvirga alba TaxID=2791025 RepID=A0A931FNS1_9HYPH|nr:hypothetical protein [Microvirga alba]MBF9233960.1 hypothetical protein [Microvirga alba]
MTSDTTVINHIKSRLGTIPMTDQVLSKSERVALEGIDVERDPDDGEVTVTWKRGDDTISLVCLPAGEMVRIVSPFREAEPPVRSHVLAISPNIISSLSGVSVPEGWKVVPVAADYAMIERRFNTANWEAEDYTNAQEQYALWLATSPTPPEQWQDISTAPKDGTLIDVWCVTPDDIDFVPEQGGIRLTNVSWHDGDKVFPHVGWVRVVDDGDYDLIDGPPSSPLGLPRWVPTHWMPLPPPPSHSQGGKL